MPKIVEVGYIVAMPDTLQKDKHAPSHYWTNVDVYRLTIAITRNKLNGS